MKKFIPYILIVVMIGTFAWLSFASSISNVKQADAKSDATLETLKIIGSWIYKSTILAETPDSVTSINA